MRTVIPLLGFWLPLARADVVEHTFNLGWRFLSPDGFGRPIITVNNQWPAPTIKVKNGDRLVVHVNNGLGNETATIHWHGMFTFGSNYMDGPAMVTQCPISPGSSFTYDFEVQTPPSLFSPLFAASAPFEQAGRHRRCVKMLTESPTDPTAGRNVLVACPHRRAAQRWLARPADRRRP